MGQLTVDLCEKMELVTDQPDAIPPTPDTNEQPDVMTPEAVATWLHVSVKWLYDHCSRSKPIVPHLRLGGHIRFRRVDIERWLDSRLQGACA
jgi:hypothetical protein